MSGDEAWWRDTGDRQLRELLLGWDPIGIAPEPTWPRDEYDDLIPALRERLRASASAGELAILLEAYVHDHMGLDTDVDREERFAQELVDWWAQTTKERS